MKARLGDTYESPVFSATPTDLEKSLHELTVQMKQLATKVKSGYDTDNVVRVVDNAQPLADSVLDFLKVAGWDR